MKKIIIILNLFFFLGCSAQMGAITPEMKTYMDELNAEGVPFMIVGMVSWYPNSVGGVGLSIIPRITTLNTIKYINFSVEPYNAVGDKVSCTIKNISEIKPKITGPINFGDDVPMWMFENAWYNQTIRCVELLSVDIEYMDGTKETYKGDTLSKVLAPEQFRMKNRWFCEDPIKEL